MVKSMGASWLTSPLCSACMALDNSFKLSVLQLFIEGDELDEETHAV